MITMRCKKEYIPSGSLMPDFLKRAVFIEDTVYLINISIAKKITLLVFNGDKWFDVVLSNRSELLSVLNNHLEIVFEE